MRRTAAVVAALVLAGVPAACSSHTPRSSSSPTSSPSTASSAPTPSTSAPLATTTSVTTSPSTGPGPGCTTAELDISSPGVRGAAGHQAAVLVFTNRGTRTCVMTGYPGVAAVDQAGHEVADAQRTPSGTVGGLAPGQSPPVVSLGPGAQASATVEGTSVPSGNQTSCPTYDALDVTPPGETHSVRLGLGLPGCSGLQVHPVVPGASGTQRS